MSDPFFTFPNCPDADRPSPPAIDATQALIQDCEVPKAEAPVFQCRPPVLADPGFIGVRIIHIRIAALAAAGKHDWIGVSMDDLTDAWTPNGRSGSLAGGSEALEYAGASVRPGPTVYLAHELPYSKKVMFTAPRTPFYIRITSGPTSGLYAWRQVVSQAGAWVLGPEAGTAAADPAREGNDLPVVPGDGRVYRASRTGEGLVVFHVAAASAGYYVKTPPGGVPGRSWRACTLMALPPAGTNAAPTDTGITTDVYNGGPGAVPGDATVQAKIVQGKLTVDVEYCDS